MTSAGSSGRETGESASTQAFHCPLVRIIMELSKVVSLNQYHSGFKSKIKSEPKLFLRQYKFIFIQNSTSNQFLQEASLLNLKKIPQT